MSEMQRVALVTGGAQGIGKAVTARFLAAGMTVVSCDFDSEAVELTAKELDDGSGRLFCQTADVGREQDVTDLLETVKSRFGRLDALINNAGIMIRKPLLELSLTEWRRVLDVNLTGTFLCTRSAAPLLHKSCGAIVNIASTRALMSEPETEAYAASKGGIVALTHALAVSLGPQVRVNSISPGWIDVSGWGKKGPAGQETLRGADHTQHPAGRVGTPEDVARLAQFLIDPENGFLTGENIVLDGGMTRRMIYA